MNGLVVYRSAAPRVMWHEMSLRPWRLWSTPMEAHLHWVLRMTERPQEWIILPTDQRCLCARGWYDYYKNAGACM
ncbi:MAG: hypothetical protein KatS3mg018_1976 [Fimbriimonadales bacterium]|nr:MAG: hypothetical protein KatS3mg018_1976 [Fimbriimonadales bacterium]